MNQRVKEFAATQDNVAARRPQNSSRAQTMRGRVAAWVNEGGAGGDDESQTLTTRRDSRRRSQNLAHE